MDGIVGTGPIVGMDGIGIGNGGGGPGGGPGREACGRTPLVLGQGGTSRAAMLKCSYGLKLKAGKESREEREHGEHAEQQKRRRLLSAIAAGFTQHNQSS